MTEIEINDEKLLYSLPKPVTMESTEEILNQMKNCIFKIINKSEKGTGFFCQVSYEEKKIPILMTNFHVISDEFIQQNNKIRITLNNDKEIKIINLDNKRKIYTNKDLDITIIEIKDDDKINNYLEFDDNLFIENSEITYENETIYIPQYPKGEKSSVSYGILQEINGDIILHKCSTEYGSLGSPILNTKNNKLLGIHKGNTNNFKFNSGIFLKKPINKFIEYIKNKNIKSIYNDDPNNSNGKFQKEFEKKVKESYENKLLIENKNIIKDNQMENKENKNNYINHELENNNNEINYNIFNDTLLRLVNEYKLYIKDEDLHKIGCKFFLINNNFFEWKVSMIGPKKTPYEDGLFWLNFKFPKDYPKRGPSINFTNKVYRLDVIEKENNHICIPRLNEWRTTGKVKGFSTYTVKNALFDIFCTFIDHNECCEGHDNPERYKLYHNDREKFDEEARKYTRLYARNN